MLVGGIFSECVDEAAFTAWAKTAWNLLKLGRFWSTYNADYIFWDATKDNK